ncbi:MAG TPA: phosphate acyltransferase PlsX [Kofleriaceae bacterium]|nr:phosphate acyltransferase PlsX [Kofleriaceae bacterium]
MGTGNPPDRAPSGAGGTAAGGSVIAVDAMGGDHAPGSEVAGAAAAVRESDVRVVLCGDRDRLRAELARIGAREDERLIIRHASQVVDMHDHPGRAFRQKRDSSMRVAFELVRSGEARAVVSAGNSGACLSHAVFLLKRLPDVERPGIVTVFPRPPTDAERHAASARGDEAPMGTVVLCDMGANVEVKPTMLAQFGILGAHYDRIVHGHARPRVGLLSNGSEDSKGTDLTRAAHAILRQAAENPEAEFDFVGYVEGSELFRGDIDVIATDGFTGNVVLKTAEGVSQAVLRMVKAALTSTVRAKLGAALARPALLALRQSIDYSEFGGAVLAGVDGLVVICHGRSDAVAMKNAIKAADEDARAGLVAQLARAMRRHHGLWIDQPAEPDSAAEGTSS